jgi:hypothetical protein
MHEQLISDEGELLGHRYSVSLARRSTVASFTIQVNPLLINASAWLGLAYRSVMI